MNEAFRSVVILAILLVDCLCSSAGAENSTLTPWRAGECVSEEEIEALGGVDNCFAAVPIPEDVWQRMQGKTFKDNPYISRGDLRYVRALHWDYDDRIHVGEMIVNRQIAQCIVDIFRALYDARYPIQRMVLPDEYGADDETQMRANNSSGFCYRAVSGSSKLSKHARGLAVDINPLYNPYYKDRRDGTRYVQPSTGAAYCDRTNDFPYKISPGDFCVRLFKQAGFSWGGEWRTCKDYQHFEFIEK